MNIILPRPSFAVTIYGPELRDKTAWCSKGAQQQQKLATPDDSGIVIV
jgi:hypothetical protein